MDAGVSRLRSLGLGFAAGLAAVTLLTACETEAMLPEPTPEPTAAPIPSPTSTASPPTPTTTPTPSPTPAPTRTPEPPPTPVLPPPVPTATWTPTPLPPPAPTATPLALGPEIVAAALIRSCQFYLEVANSAETRAVGLMNRESLGQDRGMLFVFDEEQVLGFWMKGTLIPLDIIFIDSELFVVDVQTMRPEHEIAPDPLPIYTSAVPALYAIEVNEGIAAKCGIEPGDIVELRSLMTDLSQ